MTTSTSEGSLIEVRRVKSQQLRESGCASLMDGGANRYLDGFQIQLAGFASLGEDALELML
jgi:hypothetical protein